MIRENVENYWNVEDLIKMNLLSILLKNLFTLNFTDWVARNRMSNTVVGETLAGQTLAVFWIFLEIFKKLIFIYWKNIGKTKWTRRQNRWLLIIGIVTTELFHSFNDVHELFVPRYFNLKRLLRLKFFDFCFFESIIDHS